MLWLNNFEFLVLFCSFIFHLTVFVLRSTIEITSNHSNYMTIDGSTFIVCVYRELFSIIFFPALRYSSLCIFFSFCSFLSMYVYNYFCLCHASGYSSLNVLSHSSIYFFSFFQCFCIQSDNWQRQLFWRFAFNHIRFCFYIQITHCTDSPLIHHNKTHIW